MMGTEEEKGDYLVGILACSIVLAAVFVLWALLLLFFRVRGLISREVELPET